MFVGPFLLVPCHVISSGRPALAAERARARLLLSRVVPQTTDRRRRCPKDSKPPPRSRRRSNKNDDDAEQALLVGCCSSQTTETAVRAAARDPTARTEASDATTTLTRLEVCDRASARRALRRERRAVARRRASEVGVGLLAKLEDGSYSGDTAFFTAGCTAVEQGRRRLAGNARGRFVQRSHGGYAPRASKTVSRSTRAATTSSPVEMTWIVRIGALNR